MSPVDTTPPWLKAVLGQHTLNPPPFGINGGTAATRQAASGVSTRAPKAWNRFTHALGRNLPHGMHRAEQARRRMLKQHH